MTARRRLPNRRPSANVDLTHAGIEFVVTIGYDRMARPAEIFCRARRPDSHADLIADDASVLLSLALQHGIAPGDLGHSIGRTNGEPASIVGALVDLLAECGG